jgi:hypothetical protein
MNKSQLCLGLTCLSFGILGCEAESELLEISSDRAALSAAENSERALQGVIDAADFLATSTSIADALSSFGASSQTCESSGCAGSSLDCPPPESVCTTDEVDAAALEQTRQELRESAESLVRELRERVLIEANLESHTSTSATYRLGPDVLCSESDTVNGTGADEALDEDCVEQVTRLEPRLVLTSPSEGDIDVVLQLGAARHEPLSLSLHRHSLGLRLDLGETLAVARELGEAEELSSVRELSGVLELRLVENAERDYSLELNVLEALEAVVDSDGESLSAALGASSPAWNVRVDGNTRTLSGGLDLAAFRLVGPLRLLSDLFQSEDPDDTGLPISGDADSLALPPPPEPRAYTGVVDLFLAGLSGALSYTADSDVLAVDDLGFGDATSTLKHDGNTLLALDLNAASGRRVNLRLSPTDTGTEISITPSFDLRVAFAFHYIADQFEGLADHLLDETFRVWFDGDAPALRLDGEQLQVSAGSLHIESSANPSANVVVEAGMCLGGEAGGSDEHPLLSLEATACE